MVAGNRMDFNNIVFFICQFAWLVDNMNRNSYFAYIMKKTGIVNIIQFFFAFTHAGSYFTGVFSYTSRMTAGVAILGIHCFTEGNYRLHEETLTLFLLLKKFTGFNGNLSLHADIVFFHDAIVFLLGSTVRKFQQIANIFLRP